MVATAETGDGCRIDEHFVKRITSSDIITARGVYEKTCEFMATHKIWIMTNHKPIIRGQDGGIWRRIKLIPFSISFKDNGTLDEGLKDQLLTKDSLEGVLAWAVAGAVEYYKTGLNDPICVIEATEKYRKESDTIGVFLKETCRKAEKSTVPKSNLYAAFKDWCDDNEEFKITKRLFNQRMVERGNKYKHINTGDVWLGIGMGVRPTDHALEAEDLITNKINVH
jgi:putative DNA primase/helicase